MSLNEEQKLLEMVRSINTGVSIIGILMVLTYIVAAVRLVSQLWRWGTSNEEKPPEAKDAAATYEATEGRCVPPRRD